MKHYFGFTVVSIQVDSIQIEVVSRHHRSRFDTCRKSIRFNSILAPPPEIFIFEFNSATKVESAYSNGQPSMKAAVFKYCRS